MNLTFLETFLDVFPRSFMLHGHSLRSNRRSIFCVVAASLVRYCYAFAFVLPRKYHAIAAYIANYISIEFSRTDNFVPLPTLRQLKYVSPNVKPLTVELLDMFCSVFAVGFAITRYPRITVLIVATYRRIREGIYISPFLH